MSLNNKFWKELTVTPVDRWSDDEEEQMSINRWMHGGLPCMIYNCGSVGVYCQKNWLVSAITCIHTISLTSKHQTNYNGPFSHILPHSQWNFSFTAAFKSKNFVPPRFPRHCFGASRRHGAASWKRIHAETWTHPCFIFEVWKVFLSTLKIWQSHKPQKTEVKFSPALKSVSCLRFVPLFMKINLQTWCLDPREQRKKYFGDELDFVLLRPKMVFSAPCLSALVFVEVFALNRNPATAKQKWRTKRGSLGKEKMRW